MTVRTVASKTEDFYLLEFEDNGLAVVPEHELKGSYAVNDALLYKKYKCCVIDKGSERSMQVKEELYLQDDDDDDNGANSTCVSGETTKGRPKKQMVNDDNGANSTCVSGETTKGRPKKQMVNDFNGTNSTCVSGETTKGRPKKQMVNDFNGTNSTCVSGETTKGRPKKQMVNDDNGTNSTCVSGETTKGRPKKQMVNDVNGTNSTCVSGETTKGRPKKRMANDDNGTNATGRPKKHTGTTCTSNKKRRVINDEFSVIDIVKPSICTSAITNTDYHDDAPDPTTCIINSSDGDTSSSNESNIIPSPSLLTHDPINEFHFLPKEKCPCATENLGLKERVEKMERFLSCLGYNVAEDDPPEDDDPPLPPPILSNSFETPTRLYSATPLNPSFQTHSLSKSFQASQNHPNELTPPTLPPFKQKPLDLSLIKRSSSSRGNFAKKLMAQLINERDWMKYNVSGTRGKDCIHPEIVNYVKNSTFYMYPTEVGEDRQNVWKQCVRAIDAGGRAIVRKNKN